VKNFRSQGVSVDHTPSSAISGGDVVAMADSVGVALGDIAAGDSGAVNLEGEYDLPKVSGTAWNQGARLAWDASAGAFIPTASLTSESGDVTDCAIATADAQASATVARAKLTNPGVAA